MATLASDCPMYFILLLWNCIDFNKILQEASTYKMYNVPQPIGIFLVQPNDYTIALVSYWLTRFQFLRNRCTDSNKMLGKKVQFWINFA